jgi:hypothetical protein
MPVLTRSAEPRALMFADDGAIPNNPSLPFLVYRGGIDLSGTPDPEDVIEKVFARHGWGDMWRNGIFPYVHYHSPRCASAARRARCSTSPPATSSCCRPAPGINACGRRPSFA